MKKQILILTLLLLQFGFSQEELKMSSKLSKCAALESDLARLACYDELAKKSVSINNEKSMLEKISGRWKTDNKALNAENKRTGKPSETTSSDYFEITDKAMWGIPFYLANDSIWETGICRGDDFDIAKFIIKYQDNNGTVLVQIEDWGATCYTIEKITDSTMVLGYVGARLNLHFYMR